MCGTCGIYTAKKPSDRDGCYVMIAIYFFEKIFNLVKIINFVIYNKFFLKKTIII